MEIIFKSLRDVVVTTRRARVIKNDVTLFKNVCKMSDQLQLDFAILIRITDLFDSYLDHGTGVETDVGI